MYQLKAIKIKPFYKFQLKNRCSFDAKQDYGSGYQKNTSCSN